MSWQPGWQVTDKAKTSLCFLGGGGSSSPRREFPPSLAFLAVPIDPCALVTGFLPWQGTVDGFQITRFQELLGEGG